MKNGLVSVVIPVYNVEEYLDRCIQSIIGQTYKNLEIILVDDGSPDNCPQMCDEWAKRDSRIKVVHQKNAGIGAARNTGIEHASGVYICFFDSDDYIEPDTIEQAYMAAVRNDADLVCFGMIEIDPAGVKVRSWIPTVPKERYSGAEVLQDFLPRLVGPNLKTGEDYRISMSAWSKMFSMRSIQKNNWRFVSEREIISEDTYSMLKLCADIETVCILPRACYNYCQNNTSLSRSYQKGRFEKLLHFYAEAKRLCRELGYSEEVTCRLGQIFLSFVIAAMKQKAASEDTIISKRNTIKTILQDSDLQSTLEERKNDHVPFKKKVLFWAMRQKLTDLCYILLWAQNAVK